MRTALLRALALSAIMVIAVPTFAFAAGQTGSDIRPAEAVHRSPEPGATADRIPADQAAARYQNLSTLGALALGVLGLLWVRRHTTEL